MKIGILQTGGVRSTLAAVHGEYPAMFARLLGPADAAMHFDSHAIMDGAPIPDPRSADGWVITGSRHGVYDDLPWIEPLKAMLRQARAAGVPMVGVCFGHQLLAEAFGGRAAKSAGGWHVGRHDFEIVGESPWREPVPRLALYSVHQDQVLELPPDAQVWASTPGCRIAAASYGDPDRPDAISIQPHPEMSQAFVSALVEQLDAAQRLPQGIGPKALAQIEAGPVDNARVGRWLARYLRLAAS